MSVRPSADHLAQSRLAAASFALMALTSWAVLHLYWGIVHDAVQYTMQGLAHLRPDLYGADVYLRYGSQDRFTVFGSIYASAIRLFGVDHAASILTLVSQMALFASLWQMARCLMSRNLALLALTLLAALDLPYGAGGTFHVIEDFVSPRLLCEALVIATIAATLRNRIGWAVALLAIAAVMHPIMASAGAAWFAWVRWVATHPRTAASGAALALALLIVLSTTALGMSQRFDETWWSLAINRAPYLALSNWSLLDCSRISPQLATLAVAAVASPNATVKKLALSGLGIAAAGVTLTWIGGDWLHFVLIVQAQPWRWTWLAAVLGTVILPVLLIQLWNLGHLGRSALAMLLTVYLFQDEIYAPIVTLLSVGVAASATGWLPMMDRRQQVIILWGGLGLLTIGLAWDVANRFVYAQIPYVTFAGSPMLSTLRRTLRSSCIPAILLAVWWWLCFHRPTPTRLRVTTVSAAMTLLLLLPAATRAWSKVSFPMADYTAFGEWRRMIPRGTEVLWAEHPLQTWILLEDPSYYSGPQFSTTLYSRAAALQMRQRLLDLAPFLASEGLLAPGTIRHLGSEDPVAGTNPGLADVCAGTDLRYIVTHHKFDVAPIGELPAQVSASYRGLKLYECPGHRLEPTAGGRTATALASDN